MSGSSYSDSTRRWALETYAETRTRYRSRLECCTVIAGDIGAHVNTVLRWVQAEHGQIRALTSEEIPGHIRVLEEENARLRAANRELMERLDTRWAVEN